MRNKISQVIIFTVLSLNSYLVLGADVLLETKNRDIKFDAFLDSLDLSSDNTQIKVKDGSTSMGMKIYQNDKYEAYWYSDKNSSARAEGQVVTYYLGRFLDMSRLVLPSAYMMMPVDTLKEYKSILEYGFNNNEFLYFDFKWKVDNYENVLNSVSDSILSNKAHFGAISKKMKTFQVEKNENIIDIQNETLNAGHPLSGFIKADGPIPSDTLVMNLKDFYPKEGMINTASEMTLAKDLSKIMVLDMLIGQWDRFTGGNLEARFDESGDNPLIGELRFMARDNGGAYLGMEVTDPQFTKYLKVVTRFSKKQIKKVKELLKLIDKDPSFAKQLLRLKTDPSYLKERIKVILDHVDDQERLHGSKAYF